MTKKLVIRFVKFEKTLVAQQLGKAEGFRGIGGDTPHIFVGDYFFSLNSDSVYLETQGRNAISMLTFNSNTACDEYLNDVVKWISEEQFSGSGKLKIGKECEFSDNGVEWCSGHFGGKCAKELGEPRFLAAGSNILVRFKNARPIAGCVRPKIEGDVYTWEIEVADER